MPFVIILVWVFLFCVSNYGFAGQVVKRFRADGRDILVEQLTSGLGIPWGFDFIASSELVVTERQGNLWRVNFDSGKKTRLSGSPQVANVGQGGLLDVAVHPRFQRNKIIYMTYAANYKGSRTTQLASATLGGKALSNFKVLFTAKPPAAGYLHFGSRIAFDKNGHIFLTVGERGKRKLAQDLSSHCGKVIRLNLDGSIPKDNPFFKDQLAQKEIWTLGHRNPQGLTINPKSGEIWAQEHGPQGGDEINIIRKGRNYGWPQITYGREYSGPKIGATHKNGLEQPVYHFTPSIAPSGLTIYFGDKFPGWQGHIFSGAMKLTHINHLVVGPNNTILAEHRYLTDWGRRIRNIKTGPDGYIYFSTDNGEILRLRPET